MSQPDPNADLVGYEFESDNGRLVVTGTDPWNGLYVRCRAVEDGKHFQTVRVAAQVRRARQLDPED